MAGKSNIEWTTFTWNPIAGCSILSPGCTHCYAMKMAARLEAMGQELYKGLTKPSKAGPVWTGTMRLAEENVLLAPLRRKKPTTYFVNSMSDLFHENVPDEWIDRVFAVMALCPQHIFQVLTKRAERMRRWFDEDRADRVGLAMLTIVERIPHGHRRVPWPLSNVWLGVSTERQQEADERIPLLLQTPAAVRFISAEPLLGPINLDRIHEGYTTPEGARVDFWESCLNGKRYDIWAEDDEDPMKPGHPKLDWVITGGESGPDSRPSHPQWFRDIRDACAAAGVAHFHKQNGCWREPIDGETYDTSLGRAGRPPVFIISKDGTVHCFRSDVSQDDRTVVINVGKKAAGRLLDGVEHNGKPSPPDHVDQR